MASEGCLRRLRFWLAVSCDHLSDDGGWRATGIYTWTPGVDCRLVVLLLCCSQSQTLIGGGFLLDDESMVR